MPEPVPTAYETLGVTREATPDEITRAYRGLVRRHHPDSASADDPPQAGAATGAKRRDRGPAATEALSRILAAYAVLHDPVRRADYDRRHAPAKPRVARPDVDPGFLLRARPVRWERAATPAPDPRRVEVSTSEVLAELLRRRFLR